jgi:hypothetical protein
MSIRAWAQRIYAQRSGTATYELNASNQLDLSRSQAARNSAKELEPAKAASTELATLRKAVNSAPGIRFPRGREVREYNSAEGHRLMNTLLIRSAELITPPDV